jgi:hypothetical protein
MLARIQHQVLERPRFKASKTVTTRTGTITRKGDLTQQNTNTPMWKERQLQDYRRLTICAISVVRSLMLTTYRSVLTLL